MSQLLAREPQIAERKKIKRPRLGFLGIGWIGRNRMKAIAESNLADIVAIVDSAPETLAQTLPIAPAAITLPSLEQLISLELDGIVIATPSALHAEQTIRALESGVAVFCQKPLARNYSETQQVIEAARQANKLLGVDFSYRFINGVREMEKILRAGELGKIFAVDLVFHNAYGPDKPWFYNLQLAGGGCLIDLGIHLVDLALWCLDFPNVENVTSRLFAGGEPLQTGSKRVEDFAVARLDLENGIAAQLSCSWKLPAGCDAIIRGSFYGTKGGVEFRNVNGSFYDFVAEQFFGTQKKPLAKTQENWGGAAAVNWARQLSEGNGFDPEIERVAEVAFALDRIYGAHKK